MQLGWVDFSEKDRKNALNIISMLREKRAIDELGISQIRDGFSNLLFPGLSTIQTRAKYFLLVPSLLQNIIRNKASSSVSEMENALREQERACCQVLLKNAKNPSNAHIIGSDTVRRGKWLVRPPSEIYWNGLFTFGIIVPEYAGMSIPALFNQAKESAVSIQSERSAYSTKELKDGEIPQSSFKPIALPDGIVEPLDGTLNIDLTNVQATYLRERILDSVPNSLLGWLASRDVLIEADNFESLCGQIFPRLPEDIRRTASLALDFRRFTDLLRAWWNFFYFEETEQEQEIIGILEDLQASNLGLEIDIDEICLHLNTRGIPISSQLKIFLLGAQACIKNQQTDDLRKLLVRQEILIKGKARAKLARPLEARRSDPSNWIGGGSLEYRYTTAKTVLKDIFEGLSAGSEALHA